eukprot:gene19213-biopygen37779
MAPPAFSFGLRRAIRGTQNRLRVLAETLRDEGDDATATLLHEVLCYLDDITLVVPEKLLAQAIAIAEEELAAIGLKLNREKTNAWTKTGKCPRGCEVYWKQGSSDAGGFVLVGVPFGGRTIVDVPRHAGPHQPAVQVANLLIPWCVPTKCTHLLRALPPRLTSGLCSDIDKRVTMAFYAINDITEQFGDIQQHLLETPLQYGGLGMRKLHDIREAAYVGGWLQCMCHLRHRFADIISNFHNGCFAGDMCTYGFHTEYRAAVDAMDAKLNTDTGIYAILGMAPADALQSEQAKAQKELSRAVLACKFTMWRDTLQSKSRTMAILNMARSEDRRPLASEWLTTTPYCAITSFSDDVYKLRIRQRLNIA